jgi:hypothetical protein
MWLDPLPWLDQAWAWLQAWARAESQRIVLAPLLVIFAITPVIVVRAVLIWWRC